MSLKTRKIKVALIGIGNCASSLVQGVEYYRNVRSSDERIPGLITTNFGGYFPGDIEFAAAFDIDSRKIGRDLCEAIFALPNCTAVFNDRVPKQHCIVEQGYLLDGSAPHMERYPRERRFDPLSDRFGTLEEAKSAIGRTLCERGVDVVVNLLPVGSREASFFYADCALDAKAAFVNAIPVFVSQIWGNRFKEAGLPILGDDVKSQLGATFVHRILTKACEDRGIRIQHTYQLNVGGNTDFLNMLDRGRLADKKTSKTNAVLSQMEEKLSEDHIYVGPSDYVPWLRDNKVCFLRMECEQFGSVPMNIELRLSVEDSPNSAGVLLDAIRAAKVALDRKRGGPIVEASAYLFKSPVEQYDDAIARDLLSQFASISGS